MKELKEELGGHAETRGHLRLEGSMEEGGGGQDHGEGCLVGARTAKRMAV